MSVTQASLLGDTFGSKASGTIPIGGIIMWSGAIANIPTGWRLCNGSDDTPDLRNRFIVGAGSGYSPGQNGGSADATLVSHSHTGSTTINGQHRHKVPIQRNDDGDSGLDGLTPDDSESSNVTVYGTETEAAGNHSHTLTISTEGSSATNANLPPYYALAFIMRVS
jgi:microcystin-dependent protein